MSRFTGLQNNFSGGEVSPRLGARIDLAIYFNSASYLLNFIGTVQGMVRYRDGTKFVWNTRSNNAARLFPFEYNTEQAYILEFTDSVMRIIKDGALVTDTAQDITGITQADPAVVTYSGADNYANGDRIVISDVVGMTELNNLEFEVANVNTGANTFELLDVDGNNVDSTGYTAYSSGGTVAEIIEVATPYGASDLEGIDYAQTADTMYLVHADYAPYKLTRTSHTAWTLVTYQITGNPFGITKATGQSITGITKANPAVVTYSGSDTYADGDHVFISGVVGMTEVNNKTFTVQNVDTGANTFELAEVDSTLYTTYTSGGTIEEWATFSYPSVVTFFERRLLFAASDSYPQKIWFSRSGSYDIFNTGDDADDGIEYNIGTGNPNTIRWMVGTEDFLAIGTAGAEFKATGGGENDAITPTNISIKPPSFYGSADIKPIRLDSHILFLQRDNLTARTFEFDTLQDGYTSINRTLTADHMLQGYYNRTNGVKETAYQGGTSLNWMAKNDGSLASMAFEPREQVNGWSRHHAGGTLTGGFRSRPEYESIAAIPQDDAPHEVYVIVKRTVGGATVRHVEYFQEQPTVPRFEDYITGYDPDANKDDDTDTFLQDMWEAQKRLWFVDSGLAFDGTVNQTLTLSSAAVGESITATAGAATFTGDATDVDREIWGKAGGRAVITAQSSTTVCTVEIYEAFPSASVSSGDWYFTNDSFGGLQHLAGETLIGNVDGAIYEDITVDALGTVTLDSQASYAIVGYPYLGIFRSMDLERGGDNGPAVTKEKSIDRMGMKFLNSGGGIRVGTDPYKMRPIDFSNANDYVDRPPPLASRVEEVVIDDSTRNEKYIYCMQDKPQPVNILGLVPHGQTNDS